MTLPEHVKLAKHLCRLLKVQEVTFPLARTPKGNLGLTFNANNDEYDIMLDSVPLSTKSLIDDENNIELKRMIDKYWFEPVSLSEYPTDSHTRYEVLNKNGTAKMPTFPKDNITITPIETPTQSVSKPKSNVNSKTKKAS